MIIGLIPSRLNSTRIPRKPLIEIDGLPLVVHTYKRAKLALGLDDVVVCTDSEEILNIGKGSLYVGIIDKNRKNEKTNCEMACEIFSQKLRCCNVVGLMSQRGGTDVATW